MQHTYAVALDDLDRVAEMCCAIALSIPPFLQVYGIHFVSMVNDGNGTLSITFSNRLPPEEERCMGLV